MTSKSRYLSAKYGHKDLRCKYISRKSKNSPLLSGRQRPVSHSREKEISPPPIIVIAQWKQLSLVFATDFSHDVAAVQGPPPLSFFFLSELVEAESESESEPMAPRRIANDLKVITLQLQLLHCYLFYYYYFSNIYFIINSQKQQKFDWCCR